MKFPDWFKLLWWALLTIGLSAFLWRRLPDLLAGHNSSADIVAFSIWIALMLTPVFAEVTVLGLTLKQQVDELKGYIASQLLDIKTAVDARASVTSAITVGHLPPPPDAQLPGIAEQIQRVLETFESKHGLRKAEHATIEVSAEVGLLFAARFQIETTLRRLAIEYGLAPAEARRLALSTLVQSLVPLGVIPVDLAKSIEQVLRSTNGAVHGDPVTQAQMDFVRATAPGILDALNALS